MLCFLNAMKWVRKGFEPPMLKSDGCTHRPPCLEIVAAISVVVRLTLVLPLKVNRDGRDRTDDLLPPRQPRFRCATSRFLLIKLPKGIGMTGVEPAKLSYIPLNVPTNTM